MRLQVEPRRIELIEGIPVEVLVTVTNTTDLIGGYRLRILGADPSWVRLESDTLSLFPDTSGLVRATITVPTGLAAGDRRIAVQVRELTPPGSIAIAEVDLQVPARQAVKLSLSPITVVCGKTGRFGVVLENTGNVAVPVQPIGIDPEARLRFVFEPPVITLAPGEQAIADLRATGKRRWFGSPVVRTFGVALPPQNPAEPPPDPQANASMLQRPRLGRGALSLLSLLIAVSVFAVVITIALARLVGISQADRDLAIQVAAARQGGTATGTSAVGGTLTRLSDAQPAGGVTVEIYSATALGSPLTTAATDPQGVWRVGGLAAGSYKLRFRGQGFAEIWYPHALSGTDATAVDLQVGEKKDNLAVTLGGLPATVSGQIIGDDPAGAVLTLSVPADDLPRSGQPPTSAPPASGAVRPGRPTAAGATPPATVPPATAPAVTTPAVGPSGSAAAGATTTPGATVRTIPIGSDGTFSLEDIPSPDVYDLTVSKAGFAATTQRIDLAGGEDRKGVELRLRTGDGVISGTVTGPAGGLGNAVVTASTGTTIVKTVSLTSGEGQFTVGTFILRGLVTPGVYTLTVSLDGYASETSTVTLTAGQKLTGVEFNLSRAFGTLHGTVTQLPGNQPAAGVSVKVTSGATSVTTVTESTAGRAGSWAVANLPVPGTYTLTFIRADLQSQTVGVSLNAAGVATGVPAAGIAVSMLSATAIISGTVTQQSRTGGGTANVGEAVISLTSGTATYTVNSASLPSNQIGHYEITGVLPGTYTLSASRRGTSPTTVIITVAAGQNLTFDPVMIPPASLSGQVTVAGGSSAAGLVVSLYQSSQYPAQVYRTTTTDATGHYLFPDVDAPQAYVVQVSSTTAGALGSGTLVIAASAAQTLNLTVGAAGASATPAPSASAGIPLPVSGGATPTTSAASVVPPTASTPAPSTTSRPAVLTPTTPSTVTPPSTVAPASTPTTVTPPPNEPNPSGTP